MQPDYSAVEMIIYIAFDLLLMKVVIRSEKTAARKAAAARRARRRKERAEWDATMRARIEVDRIAAEYREEIKSRARRKPIRKVVGIFSCEDAQNFVFDKQQTETDRRYSDADR